MSAEREAWCAYVEDPGTAAGEGQGRGGGVAGSNTGAYHVDVARESRVRDAQVALKVAQACRARESHRRPPASPEGDVGAALTGIGRW